MKVTQFVRLFALSALGVVGLAADSSAAIIVSDNFDGYANQAAFEASWAPIGTVAPLSGELSTAQSVSPTKSIRFPGTASNSQSRNRKTFADTPLLAAGDQLVFSFDFYDAAPTANPARNYVNLQDTTGPGSANQLVSLGLNNNLFTTQDGGNYYMARILGFTPTFLPPTSGTNPATSSGAYFKLNEGSAPLRSVGWHNLKVILTTDNATSTDYLFYVDNILAKTISNVGTAASIRQYDNIAIGSGNSNASTEAFVDNVNLEFIKAVPEPATLALGCMALLGLCGVARRRQA